MKQVKKLICGFLCVCLAFSVIIVPEGKQAKAASVKYSSNANINGNGVALRTRPTTDSTRLELMYADEEIMVRYDLSGDGHGLWYYVTRKQTKTSGWVYWQYIDHWD